MQQTSEQKRGKYQRFISPGFKPFDPLKLAEETEKIVTRKSEEGLSRKYVAIYSAPVYRGISTGYAVGCCLRCIYCWTNWSRDFPEKFGKFYTPREAAEKLFMEARKGIVSPGWERFKYLKVNKLRISGCEPTIGFSHLLGVLEHVGRSQFPLFILETNGIILGSNRSLVKKLSEFSDKLYVRVSFKAATPEGFTWRTGAEGKFYEYPFKAYDYLLNEGIFVRAAAMTDPRIMKKDERKLLLEKLGEIDPRIARNPSELEEEVIDPYDTTIHRLKASVDKKYAMELERKVEML